jgi:hypothetical protein
VVDLLDLGRRQNVFGPSIHESTGGPGPKSPGVHRITEQEYGRGGANGLVGWKHPQGAIGQGAVPDGLLAQNDALMVLEEDSGMAPGLNPADPASRERHGPA